MASVGEVEFGFNHETARMVETLKAITGGDEMDVNVKYGNSESHELSVRFMISCNEMPYLGGDTSGAISSRMLMLTFKKSFEGKEDLELGAKMESELSGIANWALVGLRRLRSQRRFTMPESTKLAIANHRREANPVLAFVQDRCFASTKIDPGNLKGVEFVNREIMISGELLYKAWAMWKSDNGAAGPDTNGVFGKRLRTIFPTLIYDKKCKSYLGLSLKSEPQK